MVKSLWIGFLFVFTAVGQAGDCDRVNLAGKWVKTSEARNKNPVQFSITQNRCQIVVSELNSPIVWKFDLEGKTEAVPNQGAIDAQKAGGEFALLAMKSVRVTTQLQWAKDNRDYPSEVKVLVKVNFPKEGRNKFDVDVEGLGTISLGADKVAARGPVKLTRIQLLNSRIKATKVRDALLIGPLADAFLMGVNYAVDMILSDKFGTWEVDLVRIAD